MPLTTTIGSAAADSYATYAEFTAYAAAQGWTLIGTSAVLETYLRRAALAIDVSYEFVGSRMTSAQAMQWPRYVLDIVLDWPVASDTIPARVKSAQMELAYAIMGGGAVLASVDGVIASERVKGGPVESDTTYQGGKGQPRYQAVDRLLAPYVISGAGRVALVRS